MGMSDVPESWMWFYDGEEAPWGWQYFGEAKNDDGLTVSIFLVGWKYFSPILPCWEKRIPNISVNDSELVKSFHDRFMSEPVLTMPLKQVTIGCVKYENPIILDGAKRLRALSQTNDESKFMLYIINFVDSQSRMQYYCDLHSKRPNSSSSAELPVPEAPEV